MLRVESNRRPGSKFGGNNNLNRYLKMTDFHNLFVYLLLFLLSNIKDDLTNSNYTVKNNNVAECRILQSNLALSTFFRTPVTPG